MSERIVITQDMIRLYDEYTHLTLDRRGFMEKLAKLAGSSAAAAAIVPLIEAPRGIATKMIACEYLVAISAKDHPLAGRTDVPLSAFRDEPFVDFEQAWGTRQLVDTGFRHAGVERRVAFEVNDLGTLIELVSRGLGVALVPEAIAEAATETLGVIRLAEPQMCWELAVATLAGGGDEIILDGAPKAFMDLLIAARSVDEEEEAAA